MTREPRTGPGAAAYDSPAGPSASAARRALSSAAGSGSATTTPAAAPAVAAAPASAPRSESAKSFGFAACSPARTSELAAEAPDATRRRSS
jgi:hypothetical protein